MRVMAGHALQIGCFKIYCAGIILSDILLSIIWPQLDMWKDCFGPQEDQINNLTAAGIISLLLYFYKIILQNLVALYQHFPGHSI